ncbi:MAG: HlyD family efflux transporter periplasmic adaptor subunit [Alphaproteobacteria bacterium]|nr:HlyD family efflux transporter periplasmic adaptor subunit [Alphaproteobacteria bacterium]
MFDEALFRQEAIEAFKQKVSGEPIARLPVSWALFCVFIMSAICACGAFLLLTEYARKERGHGWLQFTSGEIAVHATSSGVVSGLAVREGVWVEAGEPLFTVLNNQRAEDGVEFSVAYGGSIATEIALIDDRLRSAEAALVERISEMRAQIDALDRQIEAITRRSAAARERLFLLRRQYDAGQALAAAGRLAARGLEERQLLVLDQQEHINALEAQVADLAGAREVFAARLRYAPLDAEQNVLAARQTREQLERNLLEIQTRRGVLVTAPQAGRVAALGVTQGGSIQAGQRALTLVGDESALRGELYLPSRVMARVRPGLEVRIFYSAFPHRRYGVARGEIESVSATVYRAEEIPTPLGLQEAAYRAYVTLDAQQVEAFDAEYALRSGMTFDAEIVLERQSLVQWLLEPLRG